MKNRSIKYLTILIGTIILINYKNVLAASSSISASKTNAYTGENVTINVNCNAAAWNLHLSGSINDSVVGYDSNGNNTNCSKSFSLNTSTPGSYTVSLSGDITDANGETTEGINGSVTVNIQEAPKQEVTPAPTPQQNTNTQQKTEKIQKEEEKQEELKETKEENKNDPEFKIDKTKNKLEIKKFKIVGYDMSFDVNKTKYTLDILEKVDELYVIIEGKDIKVSNQGIIDIKNKDKVDITISNDESKTTYTINLNRIKECKDVNNINTTTILLSILVVVITLILIMLIINNKKKEKKI